MQPFGDQNSTAFIDIQPTPPAKVPQEDLTTLELSALLERLWNEEPTDEAHIIVIEELLRRATDHNNEKVFYEWLQNLRKNLSQYPKIAQHCFDKIRERFPKVPYVVENNDQYSLAILAIAADLLLSTPLGIFFLKWLCTLSDRSLEFQGTLLTSSLLQEILKSNSPDGLKILNALTEKLLEWITISDLDASVANLVQACLLQARIGNAYYLKEVFILLKKQLFRVTYTIP